MRTRSLDIYRTAFALFLFVADATALLDGQARSSAKTEVKPGVVSGRVFLITVAGDIKPARMAEVFLFYASSDPNPLHKLGDSAYKAWMEAYHEKMEEVIKEMQRRRAAQDFSDTDKGVSCRRDMETYLSVLSKTLGWVVANKKAWQVITGRADEEGHFRISVPRPGLYMMITKGRAGLNEAIWSDDITISPGKETTVKMSSPEVACLDTGE